MRPIDPAVRNERNTQLLALIFRLLSGKEHYVSPTYDRYCVPTPIPHPLVRNPGYYDVDFYGSPGHTASIGHFLVALFGQIAAANENSRVTSLHLWLAPVEDANRNCVVGNDVYAEACLNEAGPRGHPSQQPYAQSIMCGGMTDFSGEGGTGYTCVKAIFEFLSQLLGIPLYWHTVDDAAGAYGHLSDLLQEARLAAEARDEPSYP